MTFSTAKPTNKQWFWRCRGTYPRLELYPQDDDVQGAHRWGIYHPHMVGMHGFIYDCILHFYDRMSFGDTTSCPTFDVLCRGRQQVAQQIWYEKDVIERALPYLPPIRIAVNDTPLDDRNFAQANLDSLNPSVIRPDGSREPPPFQAYVDDALYGDIE